MQVPDEGLPRLFKTLYMNVEVFDIPDYNASFMEPVGSNEWKKLVLEDLQYRSETKVPKPIAVVTSES